jgi:hypothetical protein
MLMAFALCPDQGPPRLWRFVAAGSLGYAGGGYPIVSMLLPGNILKIDRELYDQMCDIDKHRLLRTHNDFEVATLSGFARSNEPPTWMTHQPT